MYPRLTSGGCQVSYRTRQVGVVTLKPNFGLDEETVGRTEVRELRSPNLRYLPRSRKQPTAYSTAPHKPAEVAFRLTAPGELVEVIAAARYQVRSPQPEGSEFRLEHSPDGNSWHEIARAVTASDNEYSSGWVYGSLPVGDANSKDAIVRVHLNGGGYPTGLIDFEAYGIYRTPEAHQAVQVTWAWNTPGSTAPETHRELIPAGQPEHVWNVPTPKTLTDAWVEIRAE